MGNILILTPRLHTLTGNLVTASRMADNLRCLGQHTIVMEVGTEDIEIGHVKLVMCEHEVDKVVFLHAHKTGHLLLKLQHWAEDHARTVVVLTGSDIHGECMFETLETLMAADAIVSQNRLTVVRLNSSN